MGFIIGLLTFILVVTCVVLVFLVLIQLPKKEAGAGLAFGGAASDALFGAGSGNVLTKVTKYVATIFFVLAIFLGILENRNYSHTTNTFMQGIQPPAQGSVTPPPVSPATTPGSEGSATAPGTVNSNMLLTPSAESTNLSTTLPTPPASTNPAPAAK